jgi:segregation and condensation protein B
MDITQIKHVIEAALLAAGRPLPFDKIASLFTARASELDRETLEAALAALASDYEQRGLELKEVSSGYRIQIRKSMSEWLTPLWEERAPRYTRALLETLALVAYRQPITRGEIEEVRGVAVSTNIMRTLLERNWVRVVGHRDVPGKPAMFGTTREFLDYFGLKRLEDLPPLADIKDGLPELTPQTDLIDALQVGDEQGGAEGQPGDEEAAGGGGEIEVIVANASANDADAEAPANDEAVVVALGTHSREGGYEEESETAGGSHDEDSAVAGDAEDAAGATDETEDDLALSRSESS